MNEPVRLIPYDTDWPREFARARDRIGPCFAAPPRLIEHMGSTAVPRLPAKPIIDIIILADDLREHPAARDAYLALKRDLAARYQNDREAYSKHKSSFIDAIVQSLGGPMRLNPWNP